MTDDLNAEPDYRALMLEREPDADFWIFDGQHEISFSGRFVMEDIIGCGTTEYDAWKSAYERMGE